MPLTGQVEESLREAQACLKNALALAARNEKPYISKHIASYLFDIDNLIAVNEMLEVLDEELESK